MPGPRNATRVVLSGGSVFDSSSGEVHVGDVLIEGDRIVEVGNDLDADDLVDCTDRLVMPGFFDCHVHLTGRDLSMERAFFDPYSIRYFNAAANLRATLRAGVTTVRDAGSADAGIKLAVERGLVPGPRVLTAIGVISQTGGHVGDNWLASGVRWPEQPGQPSTVVDGRDSARRVVRQLVRAGADQIKVATTGGAMTAYNDPARAQLREDELDEIVTEARAAGLYVMAHAHGAGGAKAAIKAGARSIEHGTMLDDEAIDLMLSHGTYLVPTLSAGQGVLHRAAAGEALSADLVAKTEALVLHHASVVKRAFDAGVPIALGTDAPATPHGQNLGEMELLAAAGLPAPAAWRAGTIVAARLLRLDQEFGALEAGKRADIVVAEGGADDLDALHQRVVEVWKDGVRVRPGSAP